MPLSGKCDVEIYRVVQQCLAVKSAHSCIAAARVVCVCVCVCVCACARARERETFRPHGKQTGGVMKTGTGLLRFRLATCVQFIPLCCNELATQARGGKDHLAA